MPIANRPGLATLSYRAGTYGTFLASMIARLSDHVLLAPDGDGGVVRLSPLRDLTTRSPDDFAIALLDAWAVVGDVLTFYQERIANEGFLRTATERRSLVELASLVGYRPRPGVAASTYLAFTLEKEQVGTVPAGTQVQNVPGEGERAQTFETAETIEARASWNAMRPRLLRTQTYDEVTYAEIPADKRLDPGLDPVDLYVRGQIVDLRANDLLIVTKQTTEKAADGSQVTKTADAQLLRIVEVIPDADHDRTCLRVRLWAQSPMAADRPVAITPPSFADLALRRSLVFRSASALPVALAETLGSGPPGGPVIAAHDGAPRTESMLSLTAAFHPQVGAIAHAALRNQAPSAPSLRVYRVRQVPLFGYNAPPVFGIKGKPREPHEPNLLDRLTTWKGGTILYLDGAIERIRFEAPLFVRRERIGSDTFDDPTPHPMSGAVVHPYSAYGVNGQTTAVTLPEKNDKNESNAWIEVEALEGINDNGHETPKAKDDRFRVVRTTTVYLPVDPLEPSGAPIEFIGRNPPKVASRDADVQRRTMPAERLELDDVYLALARGRWAIVRGERVIALPGGGFTTVPAVELAMLDRVEQVDPDDASPRRRTAIVLANVDPNTNKVGLAFTYKAETVTVYGNVVRATHGETRKEILGSGDGRVPLQSFELKQPPITYVTAPTPEGATSTLEVRVNGVRWHETAALAIEDATSQTYEVRRDEDEKPFVRFGDGRHGARLPSGRENVRAAYRRGIGSAANVAAGTITTLAARPPGVKEVTNPLPATGGADADSVDQIRRNAPVAVLALDRLVSTRDYADLARTFAGIGKARATASPDGTKVALTVAGAGDATLDDDSDVMVNLGAALTRYGNPRIECKPVVRKLAAVVLSAQVQILPDYDWDLVEPAVRAAVLDAFSFERRDFGQVVALSALVRVITATSGVANVMVEAFFTITEDEARSAEEIVTAVDAALAKAEAMSPARIEIPEDHIAYFLPSVPATLQLQPWVIR